MYLDTSVVVSLYAREAGSENCEAVVAASDGFFSSELLLGEMTGAVLAKEKNKIITPDLREAILAKFDAHVADGTVRLIPLNGLVVREAVKVMRQAHPEVLLRTLDAIHLATYLSVDAGPLFTRDRRMQAAARKLGIPLAG
jgi:predicted nucleic acid-binding protein